MSKLKIALLLSYICIASASAAIITPALPIIQKEFHLLNGALEWIITIFIIGYVFGQLIYGPLANRYGRLTALRTGLMINLIGIIICLASVEIHNYALLLAGRLITALGAGAGLSCTFMLIHELLNEEQAKHALSFSIVSFTVGIGLSVTIGGIVTQYWHWQDCFWILLLHGIIMLFSTWAFPETLKEKKSLHINHLVRNYLHVLKNPTLIIFSLTVGVCSVVGYSYSAAAPVIAKTLLNLSPSQYGYWNLINMLGMFSSGFAAKTLLKRYEPNLIIYFSLLGTMLCIISLIVFNLSGYYSVIWFFLTTLLLYLFTGLLFPCGSYYAMHAVDDKASGSSMMSFINMGFAAIGVMIMGYLPFSNLESWIIVLTAAWGLIVALLLFERCIQQ